jgi:16S rRNA (guanine527-N7)-methyltransferase
MDAAHDDPRSFPMLVAVLEDARGLGLLGPGPVDDQLSHALAFERFLPDELELAVDLGTGGGVPGLVLAVVRPSTRWLLVDAGARRTAFLDEAVARLGLGERVSTMTRRAEELPAELRGRAGAVTARGFGPPPVVAECAAPLLAPGGLLVVSEPPGGDARRWPASGIAELGLSLDRLVAGPPAFAVLRQTSPCPTRYPRRVGVPGKRPLWPAA